VPWRWNVDVPIRRRRSAGSRRPGMPSNKGMKQTKPSVLELRSLSPVFDRLLAGQHNESATEPGLTRQWLR
jgi:hypothetical protein